MKLNRKGFTLIELLAVIVILAIIIVIASSNVGGLMTTARKNALATEGNSAIKGAQLAYQSAILNEGITGGACFSLKYLYDKGYYTKGGTGSGYTGSVLVSPDANGLNYTYTFWISNGNYVISKAAFGAKGDTASTGTSASADCGGQGAASPSGNKVKLYN